MSDGTSIEWTDASWNPIRARYDGAVQVGDAEPIEFSRKGWHCEHVSEGCRNCYAESFNRRLGTGWDYKPGHRKNVTIFLDEKMLEIPIRWRRPRKIFVCSMTDLFADFVEDAWLDQIFAVMAASPRHQFQVLTKRPKRMLEYARRAMGCGEHWLAHCERSHAPMWPLENVWLGVSVEDQAAADERIPLLLDTPAAIRWLSMEPLLGPVDLTLVQIAPGVRFNFLGLPHHRIDWVVLGGESGPEARPMHPNWARQSRDQCQAASVPFLFKQWGAWLPGENLCLEKPIEPARWQDGEIGRHSLARDHGGPEWRHYEPSGPGTPGAFGIRVGKKRAGRELDGLEHNGYPT